MRKFLLYLLINYLAIPIIGILILIISLFNETKVSESAISAAYAREVNGYGWVTKLDKVTGFILGSSTLKYGISAKNLSLKDSVWINFSMDARDPVVSYYLLEKYYPLKKPDIILVGLDPWIYTKEYYEYRNKIMYLDLNGMEILYFLNIDYFISVQKMRSVFENYFSSRQNPDQKLYNFSIPGELGSAYLNKTPLNFQEATTDRFHLKDLGWSDIQFDYLDKINLFCKRKNIRVIYLIPPKKSYYTTSAKRLFSTEHRIWWVKVCKRLKDAEIIGDYSSLKNFNQIRKSFAFGPDRDARIDLIQCELANHAKRVPVVQS